MNEIVAELQRRLDSATESGERIDLIIEIIAKTNHETPGEARKLAAKALKMSRSLGDRKRIGRSMNCAGVCESELGNHQRALEWFEKAKPICEEVGFHDGVRCAVQGLGIIYNDIGEPALAVACFEQAVELARITGDRGKETYALNALGCANLSAANYSRALEYFLQAETVLGDIHDPVVAGDLALNIGIVYAELGDRERARARYLQSLELARSNNSRTMQINPLMNLGNLLIEQDEIADALEYYEQSLSIAREVGSRIGQAFSLVNIGAMYVDAGQYEPAMKHLHEALPIAEALGEIMKYRIILCIGRCHAGRKEYPEALEWLGRALEGSLAAEMPENEVRVHEALSICYEELGDAPKSLEHYKRFADLREIMLGQKQQRAVANLQMQSEFERAEKERAILRLEKEKLESDMEHKTRELTSMALHLVEKNRFLDSLRREMSDVVGTLEGRARPMVKGLMRQVDGNIGGEEDWRIFEAQFEIAHHDFLKRLAAAFPDLSRMELRVCALLKINLSTKEIATMLASSDRTIGNHRYRVRKKMGLDEDVNLTTFLASY
jgi:tetratricopeptide (TPR) repeat protein